MVGAALVKSVYGLPTWTRTVRLIAEHAALREAIGGAPSVHACYRFTVKLRQHGDALAACLDALLSALRKANPEIGRTVAINRSDTFPPTRTVSGTSARAGGCGSGTPTRTRAVGTGRRSPPAPVAAITATRFMPPSAPRPVCRWRGRWRPPGMLRFRSCRCCSTVSGTAASRSSTPCSTRATTPLRSTTGARSGASAWRCPAGECKPASVWIKADRLHPLIPRGTDRFRAIYHQRGAVEREFGNLKHNWALVPLRVRRIERVRLHADLTILARLACALAAARAVPLAA